MPQVEDYLSKMGHQVGTVDKKSIATLKSVESYGQIADTSLRSYGKSNAKHLDKVIETGHKGSNEKTKTGGKSRDAFDDEVLKVKSSMYDYFSMMRQVLKKLEDKKDEKLGFISTANKNKEHIADSHMRSNMKNNKHLNNTINVGRQDNISKVEAEESSFDPYNISMQEMESFLNIIKPKIEDYFLNMYTILKIQPGERGGNPLISSELIKNKKHVGEAHTNLNISNDKKNLNNVSNNQHEIGSSEVKSDESSFAVYDNTATKMQASNEVQMSQKGDYFLKKHPILKRHIENGEENLMATSKSIEKIQHVAEEYTTSKVQNDENNLSKAISDRRENEISNEKTNRNSVKNQFDRNLEYHTEKAFLNSNSLVNNNPRNNILQKQDTEKLETKKSGTNTKTLKMTLKMNDGNIIIASKNSKDESSSSNKSSHVTNKLPYSIEGISEKNLIQKADPTTLDNRLMGENEIKAKSYEKTQVRNKVIKQENLNNKISPTTSTIIHAKQNEKGSTKKTG